MAVAYRILVGFTILVTFVECQIISSLDPQITACVGDDVDLDWVYGDATKFLSVTWTYIDSQSTQTIIMQQNIGGSAAPVGGFNVVHKTNGGITLTGVNKTNSGSYKISVTYTSATASDDDTVAVTVNDCSTTTPPTKCTCDDCKCKKKCHWIVILSIVMGVLGILLLPGTRPIKGYFGRKPALVDDSIGILCGVTSFVLGIVVQAIDCCEYTADCCKDLDCCKDECKRNWIENTGVAFIVIGVLVGIAGGVIFYLLWTNRMGPGNNAYKAKEAKDPGENHGMTGTSM